MTLKEWMNNTTAHFVNSEKERRAALLSLVGKKHTIWSGPGGYNKSGFWDRVLSSIDGIEPYVQTIAEDMDSGRLFGGIDIKKFNDPDDPAIIYNVNRSWIKREYVVFEEMLDGPPSSLAAIKDAITSGFLRNGEQVEPVHTKTIIGLTNHDPREIAQMGRYIEALLERFPIQVKVEWETHTKADFAELYESVLSADPPVILHVKDLELYQEAASSMDVPRKIRGSLAHILGEAQVKGIQVSPRTAMLCIDLIKANAAINERTTPTEEDIVAIEFLPGCSEMTADLVSSIQAAAAREKAASVMKELQRTVSEFFNEYGNVEDTKSPIKILQVVKRARTLHKEVAATRVDEGLVNKRQSLLDEISGLITRGYAAAENYTREG